MPLALTDSETDRTKSGVQEPYNVTKGKNALSLHGVYRCSIPLFWVQILASPTPGIPMSRRRVQDMAAFYFPEGTPQFLTGRMVEVAVHKESLTEEPRNLQMISPEEIVHSLVAACADSIRCLGLHWIFQISLFEFTAPWNIWDIKNSRRKFWCQMDAWKKPPEMSELRDIFWVVVSK